MQNFLNKVYNHQILKIIFPSILGFIGGFFFGKPLSLFSFYIPFFFFIYYLIKLKSEKQSIFFQIFFFSTFFYFFSFLWLIKFLKIYGGFPIILGILVILFLSVYLSIYFCLSYTFAKLFPENIFIYVFPIFYWIFEYLRSLVFTGFPWNPIHLPLAYFPYLIQSLAIFGGFGFSAIVLFFFIGLAYQIIEKKINIFWLIFFIILGLFNIFLLMRKESSNKIKVGIVQVNIKEFERFVYGEDFEGLKRAIKIANENIKDVDILIFPESLFIISYERNHFIFEDFNKLSFKFPILFNANIDEEKKSYNSAILLENGNIQNIYRKMHLVPFGEYIPLRNFFEKIGFKKIARSLMDFDRGKEIGIFDFKEKGGLAICYEVIFPNILKEEIKKGAKWIAVLTNDSWYGKSLGPYQHFLFARLKAIEFHRPIARAALTGISALIDTNGRVISSKDLFEEGTLIDDLKTSDLKTPYYYLGEYPPFIMLFFLILLINIKKLYNR